MCVMGLMPISEVSLRLLDPSPTSSSLSPLRLSALLDRGSLGRGVFGIPAGAVGRGRREVGRGCGTKGRRGALVELPSPASSSSSSLDSDEGVSASFHTASSSPRTCHHKAAIFLFIYISGCSDSSRCVLTD